MHSKKNWLLVSSLALAIVAVTGCKPSTPTMPAAEEATTEDRAPAEAPRTTAATFKAGETVLALASSDSRIKTQVGQKQEGALASTGKSGVLAFGPYVSLPAGNYVVMVEGSATKPFALDVVSGVGKEVHGRKQISSRESAETLASLPFDLAAPVKNLEVRMLVTEGSDAQLTGYKIVAR